MSNFRRALGFVWCYRKRLVLSVGCALMVALLWAANISAVYPVVEILFGGQSLQGWAQAKLKGAEANLASALAELEQLRLDLQQEPADPAKQEQFYRASSRIQTAQRDRHWYTWLAPLVARYVPVDPFRALVWLLALVMLGMAVKGVFVFLHEWLVGSVVQLSLFDLRNRFYRRTLQLDLANFSKDGTSDVMSRFTYDMESLAGGFETLLGKMIREPLKALACLAGACMISWQLTLLSVLIAPLAALTTLRVGRLVKRASRRSMESMSRIYKILEETLNGIKIVKAFTMERQERRRFFQEAKNYYHKAMKITMLDALSSPVMELMGMLVIVVALLGGAYLVLNNNGGTHLFGIRMANRPLDQASLAALYALLAGISDPARKLSNVYNRLQRAVAASDRIFALMDRHPQVADPVHPKPLLWQARSSRLAALRNGHPPKEEDNGSPGLSAESLRLGHDKEDSSHASHQAAAILPHLELKSVGFEYHPREPVLQDINLRIPFGESVALVGPNGCGKTTLANLLLRFYDPTRGEIRLDGTDLRELSLRRLREQIGIVTQETVLFDDTIANNIAYGLARAKPEQIQEAARRAYAHGFIEQLPRGYQTVALEKGMLLSGGQRQRVALARAILRDPAILILDEATSALDLESEHLIHQALQEFLRSRTGIIITHRLSTLALAQRIVVKEAGRIRAVGTHEELLSSCSLYRRLNELQFQPEPV